MTLLDQHAEGPAPLGARPAAPAWLGVRFWLVLGAQGVAGLVLLLAGIHKLAAGSSPMVFSLATLGWLPMSANRTIAETLPFIEIVLGCWIVSGRWPCRAAWTTLVLLACFSIVLVCLGYTLGWREECGCGMPMVNRTTILGGLVRNGILMLVVVSLLRLLSKRSRCRTL